MNAVKPLLCILLCILLLANAGCYQAKRYSIKEDNGSFYLTIHGPSVTGSGAGVFYRDYPACFKFSSVSEMSGALETLSDETLLAIKRFFPRDEQGRFLVCDFAQLYSPVLPNELQIKNEIIWRGPIYDFPVSVHKENTAYFGVITPAVYRYRIEKHRSFTEEEDISLVAHEKELERDADVYTYMLQEMPSNYFEKRVQYTLLQDEKTVLVVETYISQDGIEGFSNTPTTIFLLGEECGSCYQISLPWLGPERPTEEWLLSFGLEPFVPEDAA